MASYHRWRVRLDCKTRGVAAAVVAVAAAVNAVHADVLDRGGTGAVGQECGDDAGIAGTG